MGLMPSGGQLCTVLYFQGLENKHPDAFERSVLKYGVPSLSAPSLNSVIGGSTSKELMASARGLLSGSRGMAVMGYSLYRMHVQSIAALTVGKLHI